MTKTIEDLDFKIPLDIAIKTIVDMGSISAVIDTGLLDDGYWTNDNEDEREEYLESIRENVTKHILGTLVKYGVNLKLEI